jgi:hypothetical protein
MRLFGAPGATTRRCPIVGRPRWSGAVAGSLVTGLLVSAALAASARPQDDTFRRIQVSKADEVLLCERERLGRPVIPSPLWTMSVEDVPCTDEATFRKALRSRGIEPFDAGDFFYLVSRRFLSGPGALFEVRWKRVRIEPKFSNWGSLEGSRTLSSDELQTIGLKILAIARTVPLAFPYNAGPDGETAVIPLNVRVDAHSWPSGAESVVSIIGGDTARLVYGEMRDGHYVALWESPLFRAMRLGLGYEDVTGDGVPEILLQSACCGGTLAGWSVTIFTTEGDELSRQENCTPDIPWPSPTGAACPITALSIRLDEATKGARDLLVTGVSDPEAPDWETRTYRYTLVNKRYVRAGPK